MRRRRLKIRGDSAVYHCVSRTVNRERLMDGMEYWIRCDAEKRS